MIRTLDDKTSLGQLRTLGSALGDLGKHDGSGAAVIVVPPMSTQTITLPDSSAPGLRIDDSAGPAMFTAIINDEPVESTPADRQQDLPSGGASSDAGSVTTC